LIAPPPEERLGNQEFQKDKRASCAEQLGDFKTALAAYQEYFKDHPVKYIISIVKNDSHEARGDVTSFLATDRVKRFFRILLTAAPLLLYIGIPNGVTMTSISSWSSRKLLGAIPDGAPTGPVVVTVDVQASNGVDLTVTGPSGPAVTSVLPSSGLAGTSIRISGTDFGASQGASTVRFNGVAATTISSWSDTTIVAAVPPGATTGLVIVTVSGQESAGVIFSVTDSIADLIIKSISNPPATAVVGDRFRVTDTTANNGNGPANPSTTNYRLSLDQIITDADPLLIGTRYIPSLEAGTSASGSVTVTVPINLAPGNYFLSACADDEDAVPESNETNNCLVSTSSVTVIPATATGVLSGVVTSGEDGSPISGAFVEVLQQGVVIASTTTDLSGAYSIAGLPVGTYDVRASSDVFVTGSLSGVTVAPEATTTTKPKVETIRKTKK